MEGTVGVVSPCPGPGPGLETLSALWSRQGEENLQRCPVSLSCFALTFGILVAMARRKQNPGAGTLLGLALVGVGGWYVWDTYLKDDGKKGKAKDKYKPLRAVDKDCVMKSDVLTEDETMKAIGQLFHALKKIGKGSTGSYDPQTDSIQLNLSPALGAAPGDEQQNVDFVQAWATELFKLGTSPKCLGKMGIKPSFGAEANDFGADFSEWEGEWPGETAEYAGALSILCATLVAGEGYTVTPPGDGVSAMMSTGVGPVIAGAF